MSDQNRLNFSDCVFFLRFAPKALWNSGGYALIFALIGWFSGRVVSTDYSDFLQKNHDAIDVLGQHAPDEDKFLHFSRNNHFNRVDTTLSDYFPIYTAALGGFFGFFYGASKQCTEFCEELQKHREKQLQESKYEV